MDGEAHVRRGKTCCCKATKCKAKLQGSARSSEGRGKVRSIARTRADATELLHLREPPRGDLIPGGGEYLRSSKKKACLA